MDHSHIRFLIPFFHWSHFDGNLAIPLSDVLSSVSNRLDHLDHLNLPTFQTIHHLFQSIGHTISTQSATLFHWIQSSWEALNHTVGHTIYPLQQFIQSAAQTSLTNLAHWSHQIAHIISAIAVWQMGLYWLLILLMVAGVIGSFVPALPGVALVLLAVLMWGVATGFSGMTVPLLVAIAAFILSVLVDNLAGLIGAQQAGASRWGQIGAIIGMGLGFFGFIPALPVGGPIVGIIFGTVLGAFAGEFLYRRELGLISRTQQSLKVGIAIVVGNLVGNLLQGILALIALIVFISNTWPTLYG